MSRIAYLSFILSLSLTTVGVCVHPSVAQMPLKAEVSLNEDKAQEIMKRADSFRQQGDLNQAIAILEGAVANGNQTAVIYQKLGDLYLEAGRDPRQAVAAYRQAENLAKAANNLKEQADALVALANLQLQLGQKQEANNLLTQAKQNYITLGDSQSVSQVDAMIAAIDLRPVGKNGADRRIRIPIQ